MNETSSKHDKVEHLMKQVRPTGPSPQLKDRVTSAAEKAWGRALPEVPWQVPLRRLAVSAVAAVLLISLANAMGNCVVPGPSHRSTPPSAASPDDLDDLYPAEYGILVTGLSPRGYRSIPAGGPTLSEYMEQLEKDRSAESVAQPSGRSRLVPATPTQSWS